MPESSGRGFFAPPGFPRAVGGVEVDNQIWLAPLAGITFASFRRFHRALGAGLVHTEMVSALGLKYKGRKTKELLYGGDGEAPCALQLFGSSADDLSAGAEIALEIRKFAALEVNMACPMPKVTKKGAGAKLLEKAGEAAAIVKGLKRFGIPVWAKVRLIPKDSGDTTEDFCARLFEAGADFIFVHGRTPAQRYEGRASCAEVCGAARAFPGRIGGSGDCYAPEDLTAYLDGGCAAALAARGALRDALLIPRTLAALGAEVPEELRSPSPEAQKELLLRLCGGICGTEGERLALMTARRMLGALFRGFEGAPRLRRAGAAAASWGEMEALLAGFSFESSPQGGEKEEEINGADASLN